MAVEKLSKSMTDNQPSKYKGSTRKGLVSSDVFRTFTSHDKRVLSSINKARAVVRVGAKREDNFTLPSCASTPYYRPTVTSIAQEKRAAAVVLPRMSASSHSTNSCEILGDSSCQSCHKKRIRDMGKASSLGRHGRLPDLTPRYLGGVKQLKNMTKYGGFEPVIPVYHYMNQQDKLEYYCPWIQSFRKEIDLPIITNHELLHRIRYRKRTKGKNEELAINSADNLPLLRPSGVIMASRPDSIVTPTAVPANSAIQTPCPPDDYMPHPPVIEIWRQWHDHHIHV